MLGNVVIGADHSRRRPACCSVAGRRTGRRHPRHRAAGDLRRRDPLRRLADGRLADDAHRPPRCCWPARWRCWRPGRRPRRWRRTTPSILALRLVDAGGRRGLYAAGGGNRRADRAGDAAAERHRLRLPRLVAGDRRRSAGGRRFVATHFGWRFAFAALAALAAIIAALLFAALPAGCKASRCRLRVSPPSRATGGSC